MIVKIVRDWNGHAKDSIIEMSVQDGRRAVDVGVVQEASIEEVKQHLKSIEPPPDNKVTRLPGYKQKAQEVASRKKTKRKKPAGNRSS